MDDVVERVMASCENWERVGREEIRVKVGQYLEKLSSAGHRDIEELTYYGLARAAEVAQLCAVVSNSMV